MELLWSKSNVVDQLQSIYILYTHFRSSKFEHLFGWEEFMYCLIYKWIEMISE